MHLSAQTEVQVTAELTKEGEANGEDGIHSWELKSAKRVIQHSWKGSLTAASYPGCRNTSCIECICFEGKGVKGTERRIVKDITCPLSELVSSDGWSTR